ncbi:MAG: hypothetical protein OEP95_00150 [Myxococcales bacterium]|nr:hypothetical protein [Myxococcales bacterium]
MEILLAGIAALLLALGCASETGSRAHWVRIDGTTPPQPELRAAARRCEEKVEHPTQSRARWNSVEWGVAMVDCLEDEGFVMVPKEDGSLGEGG